MRFVMLAMFVMASVPLASLAQDTPEMPDGDAPVGYESTEAIKKAILFGKIRLIDPWIDVPDSIEVRKEVRYG